MRAAQICEVLPILACRDADAHISDVDCPGETKRGKESERLVEDDERFQERGLASDHIQV